MNNVLGSWEFVGIKTAIMTEWNKFSDKWGKYSYIYVKIKPCNKSANKQGKQCSDTSSAEKVIINQKIFSFNSPQPPQTLPD